MNALELAIRSQAQHERAEPIDATAALEEARREAAADAAVKRQADALLAWATRNGQSSHPVIAALRDTTDPDDLIDAIVAVYFQLPGSTGVRCR